MKFLLLDVVTLMQNIPEEELHEGMVGAVVEIFNKPNEAYLVEFCDSLGRTLKLLPLLPEQLQLTNHAES